MPATTAFTALADELSLSVRGLGKSYRLGMPRRSSSAPFWALRNVDLDVHPGEVVGVVGQNGAGKSTLLKLLGRITEPTEGRIAYRGRIGSLLEVGTGFHPELTGRENIFLNGAILGMSHREIARQFDAIVDFAEVSPFLETPVKRYSSGMYVRLAFAVAAHVDPEILIVDEVLAVGDQAFQQKCLGRMREMARSGGDNDQGRTVLFVSHNMAAVRSLCTRAVLLRGGTVVQDGSVEAVIAQYLREGGEPGEATVAWDENAPGVAPDSEVRFVRAHLRDIQNCPLMGGTIDAREPFLIAVEYEVSRAMRRPPRIGWGMQNAEGILVCRASWGGDGGGRAPGRHEVRCTFPGSILNDGVYTLDFCADLPEERLLHQTGFDLSFRVADLTAERGEPTPGIVRPALVWESGPSKL